MLQRSESQNEHESLEKKSFIVGMLRHDSTRTPNGYGDGLSIDTCSGILYISPEIHFAIILSYKKKKEFTSITYLFEH